MDLKRQMTAVLQGIFLTAWITVMLFAILGDKGRLAVFEFERSEARLKEQIAALRVENRRLELIVSQLSAPEYAAEKVARELLGRVKPGELVFLDTAPKE